jgi:hypothetical protein
LFFSACDGSGSVPIQGLKRMIEEIVIRLPVGRDNDKCIVGLVQYGTDVKIECQLTSELLQFHNALDCMYSRFFFFFFFFSFSFSQSV